MCHTGISAYSVWGNPQQNQRVTIFVVAVQEHFQGRKSVERLFVLRITEGLVCLFGLPVWFRLVRLRL